jgi:hypothetical protein
MNYITFESGKEYTLAQIFSGNKKIIIPDLQRDYCWGDKAWDKDKKNHTELVSGFVQNLLASFNERNDNKNVTLGLIYGYEQPKHHVQLCDGQQRITTLYLLLGMLNRKTNNAFHKYLISDYEWKHDDKEPHLQYAIRESTLYFLSDLVCEFFLNDNVPVDKIKEQNWYFSEYDLDASIQSMIAAMITIEKELDGVNYQEFGNFILNNLEMIYYDMGDRKRGEETFVVINTTGEPLTATENLKPILLGGLDNTKKEFPDKKEIPNQETKLEYHSRLWEDSEEWFWNNKSEKETTADDGLNDFFVWYWQIQLLQEKTGKERKSLIPRELFLKKPKINSEDEDNPTIDKWEEATNLDSIDKYFAALKRLIELCKDEKIEQILNSVKEDVINLTWFRERKEEIHVVLPLIVYLVKFPNPQYFYKFVRRIRRNYFDKKRERGNFVDWRHIVQIINFSNSEEDIFAYDTNAHKDKFKKIPNVEWYNTDEREKDILKEGHKEEVEKWEDHPDLMGDLTPLWTANEGRENTYDNISSIYNTFDLLYHCYDEEWCEQHDGNIKILSNYVRLYKVLIENTRLTKPYYTNGMHGTWFSWKSANDNSYFQYLENDGFLCLLKHNSDEVFSELKEKIKAQLKKEDVLFDEKKFSAKEYLKAWLLIKVLYAEQKNTLLAFYDGRGTENGKGNGLACYEECNKNKLNDSLPFSLGNSICGFAVKRYSYIEYANGDSWGNIDCFNTILDNSFSREDFENSKRRDNPLPILPEKIAEIDKRIQALLNDFYK